MDDQELSGIASAFLRQPVSLTAEDLRVLAKIARRREIALRRNGRWLYAESGREIPSSEVEQLGHLENVGLLARKARATRKWGNEQGLTLSGDAWDLLQFLGEQGMVSPRVC